MKKENILDKIYDMYQMELSRKSRLESKTIGYYTITGIFFAAFLVIQPNLLNINMSVKLNFSDILVIINIFLIIIYIVIFLYTIVVLHKCYIPKERGQIDFIADWETWTADENNDQKIEALKDAYQQIINEIELQNNQISNKIKKINTLSIINSSVVMLTFIILVISKI